MRGIMSAGDPLEGGGGEDDVVEGEGRGGGPVAGGEWGDWGEGRGRKIRIQDEWISSISAPRSQ